MIGWSKKGGSEYKHEAPKSVLDVLVSALDKACRDREAVPIDEILPLKDPETGTDYPEYYARCFLRWLRHIEIVTKHGHQGYSIKKAADLGSTINSHWKRLGNR
jgi:hypothetical protein